MPGIFSFLKTVLISRVNVCCKRKDAPENGHPDSSRLVQSHFSDEPLAFMSPMIGRASADGRSASSRLPAWVGCLVKTVYGPDNVLAQLWTTSPAQTLQAQVDPDITSTGTGPTIASCLATRATRPAPYLSA